VGEEIEHAQLAIAEAFVGEHDVVGATVAVARLAEVLAQRDGERASRAHVRRAPQRVEGVDTWLQPVAEGMRLFDARRREVHVGIAHVEGDHLEAFDLRPGRGDVADALGVPRQPQFAHPHSQSPQGARGNTLTGGAAATTGGGCREPGVAVSRSDDEDSSWATVAGLARPLGRRGPRSRRMP